jgi:hypothetical protein
MFFIKLMQLISLANAAYYIGQDVNVDKSCFKGLSDLKCHTFNYRIVSSKNKMYKIRPGKYDTVYTLCLSKLIEEKCIKPKR